MSFSHVFISRPRQESEDLAALLAPLGLKAIVQPAFEYFPVDIATSQPEILDNMKQSPPDTLVIFTSPRAVAYGLPQMPDRIRYRSKIAAIGPATARALGAAGIRVNVLPAIGYTSEALLETLSRESPAESGDGRQAFIVSAPGGRRALSETLSERGWDVEFSMVYRSEPATLDKTQLARLTQATGVLCVWTSANAMKSLSQRLAPVSWFHLCRGDWLVISHRLQRLARAYGPAKIHLATGPGNEDLVSAIRNLRQAIQSGNM